MNVHKYFFEDTLFEESKANNADGTTQISLKLKNYIQPFERILAKYEIEGLSGVQLDSLSFNKNHLSINTTMPLEILRNRLAYCEKIGYYHLTPTLQILLESSIDFEKNTKINLPRSRRLRYGPHDIHEYRGKFFPQLVKALINANNLNDGSIVIDPMCGSGTTNCEVRSMGMETFGLDLNPLSVLIARIKTGLLDINTDLLEEEGARVLENITLCSKKTEYIWQENDLNYLQRWFDSNALMEISKILHSINNCSHTVIEGLFKLSLSNIIRTVSWQKESDLRVRKQVIPYEQGTTVNLFSKEIKNQIYRLVPYLKIIQQMSNFPKYDIAEGDAKNVAEIYKNLTEKVDILITSPPYATALPYLDTDRLSLIVLGLLPRGEHSKRDKQMIGNREVTERQRQEIWNTYLARASELPMSVCSLIDRISDSNHKKNIGFRKRNLPALLAKYFLDMTDAMRSAYIIMKPGSRAYYVVGNNSTFVDDQRIEIPTNSLLFEIGQKVGWLQDNYISMELIPSRDIFRKNRGTDESILVFKKMEENNDGKKCNLHKT